MSHVGLAASAAAHEPTPSVFGRRTIRLDDARGTLPTFADDAWDLSAIQLAENLRKLTLNFAALPPFYKLVTKNLFRTLITLEGSDGEAAMAAATIHTKLSNIKAFLEWLSADGEPALSAVTMRDLERFTDFAVSTWKSVKTKPFDVVDAVRLFYLFRQELDGDGLMVDPGQTEWRRSTPYPRSSADNTTLRIPEGVLRPLLEWSLHWVDHYAPDIFRARDEYFELRSRGRVRATRQRFGDPGVPAIGELAKARLRDVLDRYVKEGRPLPSRHLSGDDRRVNVLALAREAHANDIYIGTHGRELIDTAASIVGIDDDTYLRTETSALGDRPALPRFNTTNFLNELSNLQAACYVLIAFFSGMRDDEIKSLQRGCLREVHDSTGAITRFHVKGIAYKNEPPGGTEAMWVVGEYAARSIRVLEQLHPETQAALFAAPAHGQSAQKRSRQAVPYSKTNLDLARLVAVINGLMDTAGVGESLHHEGSPWSLATKQFRRTLAWFIARRPGGSIAGAIQFRHQTVQMFEGYLGTDTAGFRVEVEGEETLLRGEYLINVAQQGAGHFRGPSAAIADTRAANFASRIGFPGNVAEGTRQFDIAVKRAQPDVFHGPHVTCVFNRPKAACLNGDTKAVRPVFARCRPFACANVALDDENVQFWQDEYVGVQRLLAVSATLAPFVVDQMTTYLQNIAELLGIEG
ncbi:hypothetical protein [Frondihabitans australicus]|uniref:Phage integrase family protein n=1 Tax=Frondihabitans australicus TaxID=386892 RepID=A0A495ICP5_9MICO|nr:hypothetical protein [Frondihabitans australicus]RKR73689.1 hypothetical protein C8E83_0783 [Frondihabitans australicus]